MIFLMLKWISKYLRYLQRVERMRREETVVLHESAEHTFPNVTSSKLGNAVAISATLSSAKPKAHPPVLKQGGARVSSTNP